jgi:Bacterial Ig domain
LKRSNIFIACRLTVPFVIALILGGLISAGRASSSVNLTWNADTDPDIAGYYVYSGTSSGVYTQETDVGNVTSATIGNLSGENTFFAVSAYDNWGLQSPQSAEIAVQTPAVSFAGISSGLSFNSGAPITLSTTASESGGSITTVNFFRGSTQIGASGGAPYTFVWTGAPVGTSVITAVAYDTNGSSTSTQITVNVVPFGVTSMGFMGNGSFQLNVTGAIGKMNALYYSTDLQNWTLVSSAVNTTGTLAIADPGAAGSPQRFYRVSSN